MATKIQKRLASALSSAKSARARAKRRAETDLIVQPAAGFALGYAKRKGWPIPDVPGLGDAGTIGLAGILAGMAMTGRAGEMALAVGKAGATIALHQLGEHGEVIGYDDEEDDDEDDDEDVVEG